MIADPPRRKDGRCALPGGGVTPEPRFYTVEVLGFLGSRQGGAAAGGLSVTVIDGAYSREIATYRTEDGSGTQNVRWRRVRKAAEDFADTLNAEYEARELAA